MRLRFWRPHRHDFTHRFTPTHLLGYAPIMGWRECRCGERVRWAATPAEWAEEERRIHDLLSVAGAGGSR